MLDSNIVITNLRFEDGGSLSYAEGRRVLNALKQDSGWYTIGSWWLPILTDGGEEKVVEFELEFRRSDDDLPEFAI